VVAGLYDAGPAAFEVLANTPLERENFATAGCLQSIYLGLCADAEFAADFCRSRLRDLDRIEAEH